MIVKDYKIIVNNYCDVSIFNNLIKQSLEAGWELYGSPVNVDNNKLAQALILTVKPEDDYNETKAAVTTMLATKEAVAKKVEKTS